MYRHVEEQVPHDTCSTIRRGASSPGGVFIDSRYAKCKFPRFKRIYHATRVTCTCIRSLVRPFSVTETAKSMEIPSVSPRVRCSNSVLLLVGFGYFDLEYQRERHGEQHGNSGEICVKLPK